MLYSGSPKAASNKDRVSEVTADLFAIGKTVDANAESSPPRPTSSPAPSTKRARKARIAKRVTKKRILLVVKRPKDIE
ncbi:putative beta-N-acetylhexosaminidase naga [Colletotrichum sp. SAR11_240]|nr:putative beta-N-acetylhexosaminidase naga [Colletotrichum sp. SAR11_240]